MNILDRYDIIIVLTGITASLVVAICFWIFANLKDSQYSHREMLRHTGRIDVALDTLCSKQSHNACATLAWSQSDIASLIAKENLWYKKYKQEFGALLAVAKNVPLKNTKRAVFTEGIRTLAGEIPPETHSALSSASKNIFKNNENDIAQSLFKIIAYNRFVYPPEKQAKSEFDHSIQPSLCRFPKISDNIAQRMDLYKKIEKILDKLENPHKSSMVIFREEESNLLETGLWKALYDNNGSLDPRVSFSTNTLSILSHITRSRPLFIRYIDYKEAETQYTNALKPILESIKNLLVHPNKDFHQYDEKSPNQNNNTTNSDRDNIDPKIYTATCKIISKNLEAIFRLFGASFAWMDNCLSLKYSIDKSFAFATQNRKNTFLSLNFQKKPPKVPVKFDYDPNANLSQICNMRKDLKDDKEWGEHDLIAAGFWNMFKIFSHGDLSLIAKITCFAESSIRHKRISRIIGMAWGGLPLASLLSLTLHKKNRPMPLSVLSLYPSMSIHPIPQKSQRVLFVDSSLHTGFTAKSIAVKMRSYMPARPLRIKKYLFGLTPKKHSLPILEPEVKEIFCNMKPLATCETPDDFSKLNKNDSPNLTDSGLNSISNKKAKKMMDLLRRRFHYDRESNKERKTIEYIIDEKKPSKYTGCNRLQESGSDADIELFRLCQFFDKPEDLHIASWSIYDKFEDSKMLDEESNKSNFVILGGRHAVPFLAATTLTIMASGNGKVPFSVVCARRMGEKILHLHPKNIKETTKIILFDALLKDGVVARVICKNINKLAKEAGHNIKVGILAIAGTRTGELHTEKYLTAEENKDIYSNIMPLWENGYTYIFKSYSD